MRNNATNTNQALLSITRASSGCPEHPAHAQFHLLRLLAGSLIGGWTMMLAFLLLGFLGSYDFTQSATQSLRWLLIGGTAIGIALGIVFGIISGILVNSFPGLKKSIHPLTIVRIGFLALILWPLIALVPWPSTSLGFYLAPLIVFGLSWLSLAKNPHAELIPHSTSGRIFGTSVGPFIIISLALIILIPIFNRAFGRAYAPDLIVVAVDGVDGSLFYQTYHSGGQDRLPNLGYIVENGTYGTMGSTQPLVPEQVWANMMTSTEYEGHSIIDIHSTSDDFTGLPIWEIAALYGKRVGLFQAPPPHHPFDAAAFDIPPPKAIESTRDPLGIVLANAREIGGGEGLPGLFRSASLACLLARHGVKLDTFDALVKQYLTEWLLEPSWRLTYQDRKFLEFRIQSDCAISLLRKNPVDVAILRFPSFGPLFQAYWRYIKPNEFLDPPPDVDSGLATGLGRVIPDVYSHIDEFAGRLRPFIGRETILTIASNYGIRSASDRRNLQFFISPERLLSITGFPALLVGDISGDGICVRAWDISRNDELLDELESVLRGVMWVPEGEEPGSRNYSRSLFNLNRYGHCLGISVITSGDLKPDAVVTIGNWEGILADVLRPGEPPSGMVSANALLLIDGYQFTPGSVASNPTVFDITPTLLHAMGIDIAESLMGRPMDEIYDPGWFTDNPPNFIEEYTIPAPEPEPLDAFPPSVFPTESIDLSTGQPESFDAGVIV